MSETPFAIALRLAGQDHALEPGRDYLLGKAADCDLRLTGGGIAGHHARLCIGPVSGHLEDLSGELGTCHNGARVAQAPLAIGDVLQLGEQQAVLVRDEGLAMMVPIPALRAAATARRLQGVRLAAAALRHDEPESFHDLMAKELRRAPWLACSLLVHVVLLLLLWLWLPDDPTGDGRRPTVCIELAEAASLGEGPPAPPETVVEAPPAIEVPPESTPEAVDEPPPPTPGPGLRTLPSSNPRIARRRDPSPANGGATTAALPGIGSGEFQQTVAQLRKSGLEIVFVFDSTGSMTRTITDTKSTIVQMLTVLRALVPDARVGLVTYRDRGPREDYLVRQLPLDTDFWRASNFVQFVVAEGGGDRPEDVRSGLRAAFEQNWRSNARRVVVLAGDAPPHGEDIKKLMGEVRAFAANGHSFVHTLVTSPDLAGRDTQMCFADIAEAGHGTCTDLRSHDRVLQRVLSAAFGREFDEDLAAATRSVLAAADHVDTAALDLARRGGPDLARELRRNPVPVTVLNALVKRPRRAIALELVDLLGDASTSAASRQAIASVLQRVLELPVPPIDPATGERPMPRELERLRRAIASLDN